MLTEVPHSPPRPHAATLKSLGVLLGLSLVGSTWAQTSYLPVGPQENVPVATVTAGGWTECYRDTYGTKGNRWTDVQAGCSGERLMLACRPTGSTTLQLLAQAPREDVLTDTGINATTVHTANGSDWYWNNNYSWGFTQQGAGVSKSQCDDSDGASASSRLCWHTVQNAGGDSLAGGYRCGAAKGLNDSSEFERIIYTNNAVPIGAVQPVPSLSSWSTLALALLAGAGAMLHLRRQRGNNSRA